MLFLTQGDTWYGRRGFKPYNSHKDTLDEQGYADYINNQKIIKSTKIKDIKLYEYISDVVKDSRSNEELNMLKTYLDKHKEDYMTTFFHKFMMNYDKMCDIFGKIYEKIFKDLKLRSFHDRSFFLDL